MKYRLFGQAAIRIGLTALLLTFGTTTLVYAQRTTKVTFNAGIYRDWDHTWMTTAMEDVVATLTSHGTTYNATAVNSDGKMSFGSVLCGGNATIHVKFVGTGSYKQTSRNYTKAIPCGKPSITLGRLEYGRW